MANAEEVRGDGHQAPLKNNGQDKGMAYSRRQLFTALLGYRGNNPRRMGGGASQAGPPQKQKRLKPPPAVQEERRLMPTINYGLRGGADHAPAHLRAAGGAAHAPTQLRAAEGGRLTFPPI